MPDLTAPFARALTALALLALDPGLGGVALRARPGPVRDALAAHLPAAVRLHPAMADDALFGGPDLAATLAAGRLVQGTGVLAVPGPLVLPMAERAGPGLAARLGRVLDDGAGHVLIAFDEGAAADEGLLPALAERLAFAIDLTDVAAGDAGGPMPAPAALEAARAALPGVAGGSDSLPAIAALCDRLGIASARAPLFALRAARALAALAGRDAPDADDIAGACALTLAHRATRLPEEAAPEEPPPPPEPPTDEAPEDSLDLPAELLLDAVRAMLPPDLLDRLRAQAARAAQGSGAGAARRGNRRGRPLPPRPGRPEGGARIDLVATLRTAAPWQRLRRATAIRPGLQVRAADLRVKRFEDRSDRLLIFAVDASGSAALARLAEAKGAVELLLAQAYARRDHVALIAFRGTGAEVLLPPTRSLVQTKRRLADLPGGGATPLAAGLRAALDQAQAARRRGLSPAAILLTDGRANIALDGRADRTAAAEDAVRMGRAMAAAGIGGLVIDTGNRPDPGLATLARGMGLPCLPLPRADARRLSATVAAALGD